MGATPKMPKERVHQVRNETKELPKDNQTGEVCMTTDLTMSKLEGGIRAIRPKKAPGPNSMN